MSALDVLCVTPSSAGGWGPITDLTVLAGRTLGTDPRFVHPAKPYGFATKIGSLVPQIRRGDRALLLIAAQPGDLLALSKSEFIRGKYGHVSAWIIDSFWDDRIPFFARHRHGIDSVWITDAELIERYSSALHRDVGWLPWGTDALAANALAHDDSRRTDVMRLGRQPEAWNDDACNEAFLAEHDLSYSGRFPDAESGPATQHLVRTLLADAKVVLASSNLASSASYTHPFRDYISARFTDAVAAGTQVAGSPPRSRAADLLPDDLWVELDVTSRDNGIAKLQQAVTEYSPVRAKSLRRHALLELDWRHRLQKITKTIGVTSPLLEREITQIHDRVGEIS